MISIYLLLDSGFANPDRLRLCIQNLNLRNQKNDLFIFAGLHSLLGFANPEMRV